MACMSLSWRRAATLIWKLIREMPPRASFICRSLVGDRFGVADHECSAGAAECFELAARDRRPAALLADFGEGFGVAREEVVCGLLVGVGDVAQSVNSDFEFLGGVTGAFAGFAVEVDEVAKTMGLAADDRDHERKTEDTGADEGFRRATDAEPDGERVLQWARVDALPGERGPVFAGPMDVGVLAEGKKEVEFFGEKVVVVFEIEAEEGEGFDEGPAAGDDFCASVGDEVERGEVLKDANGICRAEDRNGRGETDVGGACGRGG